MIEIYHSNIEIRQKKIRKYNVTEMASNDHVYTALAPRKYT